MNLVYLVRTFKYNVAVDNKHVVIAKPPNTQHLVLLISYFLSLGFIYNFFTKKLSKHPNKAGLIALAILCLFLLIISVITFYSTQRKLKGKIVKAFDLKDIKTIVVRKPLNGEIGFINFVLHNQVDLWDNQVTFGTIKKYNQFQDLKNKIEKFKRDNTAPIDESKNNLGLNELEKLYELKEKGVITEEDYIYKKRQILG